MTRLQDERDIYTLNLFVDRRMSMSMAACIVTHYARGPGVERVVI